MSATWNPAGTALIQTDDRKRETVLSAAQPVQTDGKAPQAPKGTPTRPR